MPKAISYSLLTLILVACSNDAIFDEVTSIPPEGWHYSNELEYTIPVSDTSLVCDVLIHIRNSKSYDYSNLWLFVTTSAPNGDLQRDTLEIMLADQTGHWAGTGTRSVNSMLVSYLNQVKFPYRGVYTMHVQQAMRDTLLHNIIDFGVRIESNN